MKREEILAGVKFRFGGQTLAYDADIDIIKRDERYYCNVERMNEDSMYLYGSFLGKQISVTIHYKDLKKA